MQSVALPAASRSRPIGIGQLWVHFSPSRQDAASSPAKDVLTGAADPDRFHRASSSSIGTSAVGLLDLKTTPMEPAMPGVEVHAQLLESMLGKARH